MKTKNMLSAEIQKIILDEIDSGNQPTEDKIARKLGISRTPVREVLKHLEEEGLLERRQGKGISVKEPSLKELIEVYDLRSALEGLACRLLIQRLDDKILKRLKELAKKYARLIKKGKPETHATEMVEIELAFHQLIISECGNARLRRVVDGLHLLTRSFQIGHRFELRGLGFKRKYTHDRIVKALEKRDAYLAELTVKLHIQETKMRILNIFFGHSLVPVYPESEMKVKYLD